MVVFLSLSLSPYVVEVRVAERWYLFLSLSLSLSVALCLSLCRLDEDSWVVVSLFLSVG